MKERTIYLAIAIAAFLVVLAAAEKLADVPKLYQFLTGSMIMAVLAWFAMIPMGIAQFIADWLINRQHQRCGAVEQAALLNNPTYFEQPMIFTHRTLVITYQRWMNPLKLQFPHGFSELAKPVDFDKVANVPQHEIHEKLRAILNECPTADLSVYEPILGIRIVNIQGPSEIAPEGTYVGDS